MKRIFIPILAIMSIFFLTNCSNSKEQELLKKHIEETGLSDFKLSPMVELYVQLLKAKTNTNVNIGFESEFYENSDSIIDCLTIELIQDSIELNHKELDKTLILSRIANDMKPLLEKEKTFDVLSLIWTEKNSFTENVGASMDVTFKTPIKDIPNTNKSRYKMVGDTIKFEDYFYNDSIAYKGQIINQKRVGFWEYWYSNGKKKKEGQFQNDEKIGNWKYWSETGDEQK